MAGFDDSSHLPTVPTNSYETALCVIPPAHKCSQIDQLRSLYDKGWRKWPPHISLIYPFVAPEALPRAKEQIQARLADITSGPDLKICLNHSGYFSHRTNNTVFISERESPTDSALNILRSSVLQALGQAESQCNFHLTVGQSEDRTDSSRDFLLSKARLLPQLDFEIESLTILVRERTTGQDNTGSRMRLWSTIDISRHSYNYQATPISEFWIPSTKHVESNPDTGDEEDSDSNRPSTTTTFSREIQPGTTFWYDVELNLWTPCNEATGGDTRPPNLSVASYNVLIDSGYPPTRERDPLLLKTILSRSATADILVLQEVSDDFLSCLLTEPQTQRRYPFATHGPPNQQDIGPLPSLRNVVILSRFQFTWEMVPFHRRHKVAVAAKFNSICNDGLWESHDLVVAGIHLTSGLTDGSVAAKKAQLHNLKSYLGRQHPQSSWVIAGDFNMTTSSYTIQTALKNKSISRQTAKTLTSMESMLTENGVLDAWSVARVQAVDATALKSDDIFEGEDGATFNPRENELAAVTSSTSLNRPQRYDRILVRPQGMLRINHFNHFGLPEDHDGVQVVPSDHSGIRASMKIITDIEDTRLSTLDTLGQHPVQAKHVSSTLADTSALVSTLVAHGMFPNEETARDRKGAFALIKEVLLGSSSAEDTSMSEIPMVIVPVGSYALGVWTSASDIDCLCIGPISSKTFFKLARQRIRRADTQGVRFLRKVEANTGTMFEISVNGVSVDLQYCPAARIVERWAELLHLHHTDPIYNLSMLSLRKLKPYRDIIYIQRSLPSLPAFRIAYRCIKLWAVQHGLYSSKFGYLGGIHITLMLSWICKRLVHDVGTVSAADIVATFFHHYAQFDWKKDMVFDAFFHRKQPRYQRSAREPMVVLGFHAPNGNVAHTSTVPGLNTLIREFKLVDQRFSEEGMTWDRFLRTPNGAQTRATEFLKSHDSYAQINIQYWGGSLAKGKGLVGWVESRCLNFVVEVNKSLPNLEVRIWPARFTNSNSSSDAKTDYHGCYLIGLSKNKDAETSMTKDERSLAKQALQQVSTRFLNQIHNDEKYYDTSTSWIDISLAKPHEVQDLRLDTREWGTHTPDFEDDSDSDSDSDDGIDNPPGHNDDDNATSFKLSLRPTLPSSPFPRSTPKPKLRPASDVLNRLRWDPHLDPSDHIVGYEDRFLGVKEMGLERWKTESTHEEFIPQHRIAYFRRKGDGVVVWDRRGRIDEVFGSGVRSGEGRAGGEC